MEDVETMAQVVQRDEVNVPCLDIFKVKMYNALYRAT